MPYDRLRRVFREAWSTDITEDVLVKLLGSQPSADNKDGTPVEEPSIELELQEVA
jgi:hypothetical protein